MGVWDAACGSAEAGLVGGLVARIEGGKFDDGFSVAAAGYLLNTVAHEAANRQFSRQLTNDEISAAREVFGAKIDYSRVRIIDAKYVFTQSGGYAMTPNGNIYWPGACSNLVECDGGAYAPTFIHEMTHVLQYQSGINVLMRGFFLQAAKFLTGTLYNPYSFTYDPARPFSSYNIEQQGDIAVGIYIGIYPNNIDLRGVQ